MKIEADPLLNMIENSNRKQYDWAWRKKCNKALFKAQTNWNWIMNLRNSSSFSILAYRKCYNFLFRRSCLNLHNVLSLWQCAWTVPKPLYQWEQWCSLSLLSWPQFLHHCTQFFVLDLVKMRKVLVFPSNIKTNILKICIFSYKQIQYLKLQTPDFYFFHWFLSLKK